MKASVVGEVLESNAGQFSAGDIVTGELLWAEHAVADANELQRVNPDHGPISTALGVLGMPGVTAYWGLNDVGDPKPGDTVFVSAAAGAVGSVVGQLARLSGARVVGTAGSEAKIDWLTDDLASTPRSTTRTPTTSPPQSTRPARTASMSTSTTSAAPSLTPSGPG